MTSASKRDREQTAQALDSGNILQIYRVKPAKPRHRALRWSFRKLSYWGIVTKIVVHKHEHKSGSRQYYMSCTCTCAFWTSGIQHQCVPAFSRRTGDQSLFADHLRFEYRTVVCFINKDHSALVTVMPSYTDVLLLHNPARWSQIAGVSDVAYIVNNKMKMI